MSSWYVLLKEVSVWTRHQTRQVEPPVIGIHGWLVYCTLITLVLWFTNYNKLKLNKYIGVHRSPMVKLVVSRSDRLDTPLRRLGCTIKWETYFCQRFNFTFTPGTLKNLQNNLWILLVPFSVKESCTIIVNTEDLFPSISVSLTRVQGPWIGLRHY